jgi:lipid-A-disaccharide synthase
VTLMFIAGEASGDAHAAKLIEALRAQAPDVKVFGAGGAKMQAAGMELLLDLTEHAVVGLVEVLKNYGTFRRIFWDLVEEAEKRKPDAVVLVDFPGFNLRFAAQMKERGIRVIYYISPQLWAWHASRAKQIERDVDLMLCIFPFEKDWYSKHAPKLRVEFVGHPFAEKVKAEAGGIEREKKLVLLLPGSREREVAKIFPIMAGIVDRLPKDLEFIAEAVNEQSAAMMMSHPRIKVELRTAHELMQHATLAITASGTATMECAFYGCPMIVVYKVNWLTYLIGRMVVQVDWLGMPNVIAGREIIPEFIQHDAEPEHVAVVARELLKDDAKREAMLGELAKIVAPLGGTGASEQAAKLILGVISHG